MDFIDVRERLERECTFPVEHERLVERFGDLELDAVGTESETVGEVLARSGEREYQSAEGVYTTLLGTVDDSFIGRKHYDGRGGARSVEHERPTSPP